MPISHTSVNHELDEEVVITKKKIQQWGIPFIPIGKLYMYNPAPEQVDAMAEICKFTKPELALLDLVRHGTTPSGYIDIVRSSFEAKEHRSLAKGIALWIEKGLIKRVSREHYMISPWFIVPKKDLQDQCIIDWRAL